jgi:hypothetical protein
MGTTLTGTTPQDTYDSLIKVTDNGPISGTLKALSDGLGNDSTLSLSTTAASIAGTLAVTGDAAFDTDTLFVDVSAGNVGIGTSSPALRTHIVGTAGLPASTGTVQLGALRLQTGTSTVSLDIGVNGGTGGWLQVTNANDLSLEYPLIFNPNGGNVGIGTTNPTEKLHVNSGTGNIQALFQSTDPIALITFDDSDTTLSTVGLGCSGDNIVFYQDTEKMRITSAGVLELAQGQIKFPATQVPSADPNTLDDYEEGIWTMGVSFGGGSTGVTYDIQGATYTKIGRQVTVNGFIILSSKGSSTGVAEITGLPFTLANTSGNYSTANVRLENVTFANQFQAYGKIATTVIALNETTEAGVNGSLTDADFANNSTVMVSLTYFV